MSFTAIQSYAMGNCKQWQSTWSSCKTDSDCVVISNPCGWPTSASNKKSFEEATKCNRIEGAALSCATWDEVKGGKRVAVCVSGECKNKATEKIGVDSRLSPETVCKKKGGRWEGSVSGRGRLEGCNMPTLDAGKECEKGEDCESVCLKDGTCHGWSLYKGCARYKGREGVICLE